MGYPNRNTISAMLEAEEIAKSPSVKGYTDLDELFAHLEKNADELSPLSDIGMMENLEIE